MTVILDTTTVSGLIKSIPVDQTHGVLISINQLLTFNWVMLTVVCQMIAIIGVGTNIINIVCFIKQGFKDPFNVSLMGLAISDMGCLITVIWVNICFTPAFSSADLSFDPIEVTYLTGGIPHTTFTRITGWITAVITLERCLCVIAPLKVKTLVSSKRTIVIIVCIYIILMFSIAPMYAVYSLENRFVQERNKTILGIAFTNNREIIERISFRINNVSIPFTAFVVIIISTLILAIKLKRADEWRRACGSKGQSENVSLRNQKVAKMVVILSILFIVSYVPLNIIFITMSLDSRFAFDGKFRNLVIMLGGLGFVLETINSSVNIVVYHSMSSKYRAVFIHLFCSKNSNSGES